MHGSMWRELETEQGTCPWSLGWDNHPGNRGRHEGPRTSRQEKQPRQFPTLLTFQQRCAQDKHGSRFSGFNPARGDAAQMKMNAAVREWKLHRRTTLTLDDLAHWINPIVRGWMH